MEFLGALLGSIMGWCYNIVNNYGLAIILFTLISKIVLLPVSVWVQLNSIKMVKMQPELNRIKIDHFGDKDTIAEETQRLYKKNKYHATASLIPLALQIILLLGVVSAIYHPMNYILNVDESVIAKFEDVAIENDASINPESSSIQLSIAKQIQSGEKDSYLILDDSFSDVDIQKVVDDVDHLKMNFLGFDLSWIPTRDGGVSLIVPLIAGFSAWLLSFAQNRMNVLQAAQSKYGNYATMAVSVGISLYLGFFVPSGVALYWIASNLFTILQQYLLNKAINPKKHVDWEELESTRKELATYTESAKKNKADKALVQRCKQDYKKFLSIGNKHLVFYSESNGFYKYYAGTIDFILKNTNIPIHYITSDPNDNIFEMAKKNEQIKPYYIDSQKLITLMMRMDADVVVMTMPDLETFQIKRSYVRKDVEYIYVPHCTHSMNLTMRQGSTDYFDAVLVTGKHQREEQEAVERVHHIENQTIVDAGYPLLDDLTKGYENMLKNKKPSKDGKKTVLIAPSWQKDNIVDSCLNEILDLIKDMNFNIIVRPHPQHVRHMPERMEQLKQRYASYSNIEVQTDFSSNDTVFMADAIISDWSGIAYEYAFATLKPVLFVNTPMKVMNPDYKELDIVPFNVWLREKIGGSVDLDELDKIPEMITDLLEHQDKYHDIIKGYRDEYHYNFGHAGEASARFIIHEVMKKTKMRQEEEKNA